MRQIIGIDQYTIFCEAEQWLEAAIAADPYRVELRLMLDMTRALKASTSANVESLADWRLRMMAIIDPQPEEDIHELSEGAILFLYASEEEASV